MILMKPVSEQDRSEVESWIAAEPTHANNTFEFYQQANTRSLLYSDEEGPVLVVKFTPSLVMDAEFNPRASGKRIAAIMSEGFPELERQAKEQGFRSIVYESVSEKLIKFCEKYMGFKPSPSYRKAL